MFGHELTIIALAAAVTVAAGFVKGVVGFAMPMIMISGIASFLPAEQAIAALIMPTLLTNLIQSLRQGIGAALKSTWDYRRLIATICLLILVTAQFVPAIPQALLLASLGVPIVAYAVAQLMGYPLRFDTANRNRAEVLAGIVGGFYGGLSGIWGPPTIALLISLGVEKTENIRVQGVVYTIGSVVLFIAHWRSGVVNAQTLPFSLFLVLPALVGLWLGFKAQDKLDAARFRRWTLIVLAITGLNLVRRALTV
ncbi:MAG: sulfite exporter TauE/SafE family protein [Paracoccaceae bacterium]